ncbi:ATP-binding cassette domain-containing protein [Thermodesulfatator indicus]
MLKAKGLSKIFTSGLLSKQRVNAVDNVDIEIKQGEILALVGESGSGKSTLGRLLLMLMQPTKGEIHFNGHELTKMKKKDLRKMRKKMQLIPQHPEDSLDPLWKIYSSLAEPLRIHGLDASKNTLLKLIEMVGLREEHLYRYPHELSGGELQRVMIARAISLRPKFIVCDEPTSMLDMSVQAAIARMLLALQEKFGLSYLFITHDLELAKIVAHRTAVMYAGQIVEEGVDVFESPFHPYTEMLLKGVKEPPESTEKPPGGCRFYDKCPKKGPKCLTSPEMVTVNGRKVRCHLFA